MNIQKIYFIASISSKVGNITVQWSRHKISLIYGLECIFYGSNVQNKISRVI